MKPGDLGMIIEPSSYGKQVSIVAQCCHDDSWKVEAMESIPVVDVQQLGHIHIEIETVTAPGDHFCIKKRFVVPLKPPPEEEPTNETQPLETETAQ